MFETLPDDTMNLNNRIYKLIMKYLYLIPIFLFLIISAAKADDMSNYCLDNMTLITNFTYDGGIHYVTEPCSFGCNSLLNECNKSPYAISSNNFFDVLIIIFFLGNLGVLFLKIYNLSQLCQGYSKFLIFVTMIFSLISWFIMMTYLSFKPSLDTSLWMTFTNLITSINFFLMMMEILIIGVQYILSKRTKAREPLILNRPRRP
jgi:hypothetical protein